MFTYWKSEVRFKLLTSEFWLFIWRCRHTA